MQRFESFEVRPVAVLAYPGNTEEIYQAADSALEAQAIIEEARKVGQIEYGSIVWTLYGRRDGVLEAIADKITEDDALDLLYSITGIAGVSGQRVYAAPPSAMATA